jgi:hypothetical protein
MPWPKKGEEKANYMARAIKMMMEGEGLNQNHAVAKAINMWKQKKPKKGGKK